MMANYELLTSNLNSPFYMREVNRHYRHWGKYPDYFISHLNKCDRCLGYFSKDNMYSLKSESYANCNYPNVCRYCNCDSYFRNMAKSKILNETKIRYKDQDNTLVELEMIVSKTRYLLSNRPKIFNPKYIKR